MYKNQTICDLVREAERHYTRGKVRIGKFVEWSMSDTVNTIDAYLNSKHITGSKDSLGRDKPFFNIVTAVANLWYRATDIDRKDITIYSGNSKHVVLSFVATVLLHDWMIRERFGVFLNLWGRALSRYGGIPTKFVKKEGRLIPSVVSWSRFIPDPVAFDALPAIEKLYYTPEQLRKNSSYDQDQVEKLLTCVAEARKNTDGEALDLNDNFIEVYEVSGELPVALLKPIDKREEKDWITYRQQMHAVSFVGNINEEGYSDFTLYRGSQTKSPYVMTSLIEEEGRTLPIGSVEYLFDAQWMVNHTIKQQKDYLDLASKLIFQTSDQRFVGRNVLSSIENGDILIHQPNQPLKQINNTANNMNALIQFGNQWLVLAKEITSTPDAMRGNNMPSGTPYSLVSILQQQAGSLFEIMTENKGLAIEDMLREHVLPFLKSKMDTSEEISAILDDHNISKIDAMYVPQEAIKRYNKKAIDDFIDKDVIPSPYQADIAEAEVQGELSALGNQRFFKPSEISTKTWSELLKDFEWNVRVEVTNEARDKKAALETLNSVLTTIGQNPAVLQDENARMLLSEILKISGTVSPLQIKAPKVPSLSLSQVGAGSGGGQPLPAMQ